MKGITSSLLCCLASQMHLQLSKSNEWPFCPYIWKFILVFFNDILVYSQSWEDHISYLCIILTIYQPIVYLQKIKMQVWVLQVEYLSYTILE